jgi:excisionase family DNA binding protein
MSALAEEIKSALREVLREELPRALAQLGLKAKDEADAECLIGVQEAAQRLGLSVSTIYKRAERCELPSVKDGGRLLFKTDDLMAYAEGRRRSPERVHQLAIKAGRAHKVIQNGQNDERPKAEPGRASPKYE